MHDFMTNLMLLWGVKRRRPGDPLVPPPRAPKPLWLNALIVLAIVNFFAFALTAEYLGGDAVNGYVQDGHYFLAAHGHHTEVARSLFMYSKWHAYSVFVSFGTLIITTLLFDRYRKA